tara:strand:+ start:3237 stop:3740 length:504 start_codon:yes stop_codon:yes gene_type:complete
MRITKRQLRKIVKEEVRRLAEDSISDELDNLRKNIDDDKDHIDNLEKDIKDDREEMERAHEEELEHEREKHESRRRRGRALGRRQLRQIVKEEKAKLNKQAALRQRIRQLVEENLAEDDMEEGHQGYDDKEDESLGMRTGAESGKKQSYRDRRDDSYGRWGTRDRRS